MTVIAAIAALFLAAAAGMALLRIIRGPSTLDRIVGTDVLLAITVCAIATEAAYSRDATGLPILLGLSLLGAAGSVAVARFADPVARASLAAAPSQPVVPDSAATQSPPDPPSGLGSPDFGGPVKSRRAASTAGVLSSPGTAETPGTEMPSTAETSSTTRTPRTTGTPCTSGAPTTPRTPTTPQAPTTPGTPTTPQAPTTPGTPTTPQAPTTPRTPTTIGTQCIGDTAGEPREPGWARTSITSSRPEIRE